MNKELLYRKWPRPSDSDLLTALRKDYEYDEAQGGFRCIATKRAAGHNDGKGYLSMRLLGHRFKMHRLLWLWHHGYYPESNIDHINGEHSDNRIENLRLATDAQNVHNRIRAGKHSPGVYKQRHRYIARIQPPGDACKKIYLGYYDTEAEAAAAYAGASIILHGEYAAVASRNGWDADGAHRPASPSVSPSVTMNDGADTTIRTWDQRFTKALPTEK